MSSLEYYNNLVGMNEMFYESHKRVIERICLELGVEDRVDELIEKYLDNKFKIAKVNRLIPKVVSTIAGE